MSIIIILMELNIINVVIYTNEISSNDPKLHCLKNDEPRDV